MNNRIMAMLFALVAAMFISIVPVKAEAASCTGAHVDTYQGGNGKCDVCGEHVHRAITHDKVDATCAAEGNVKYYTCNFCDAVSLKQNFTNIVTLDKVKTPKLTTHTVEKFTNQGAQQHWGTCTVCKTTVKENHSTVNDCDCDAVGCTAKVHALVEVPAVAANHASAGNIAHFKCSRTGCGKLFADNNGATELKAEEVVTAKVEHDLQWTATKDGHKQACTGCGYVPVAQTAHVYGKAVDNKDGTHSFTCETEGCGYVLTGNHNDKNKDCKCDNCAAELEHNLADWGKDTNGHWNTCLTCRKNLNVGAHNFGEAKPVEGHTYHVKSCVDCGFERQFDCVGTDTGCQCKECGTLVKHVEADMEIVGRVEPTCEKAGNIGYNKCKTCGNAFSVVNGKYVLYTEKVELDALGHKFDATWTWYQTEDGTGHYKNCANGCETHVYGTAEDVKVGEELHTHDHFNVSEDAHEDVCAVCKQSYGYEKHEYTQVELAKASSTGTQRHKLVCECGASVLKKCEFDENCVCKICGDDKVHDIAALSTVPGAKDPTCTATGMKTHYKCNTCENIFFYENGKCVKINAQDTVIPALGHKWVAKGTDVADGKHVMKCENKGCTKYTVMPHYTEDGDCYCDVANCKEIAHSHKHVYVPAVSATCTEEGVEAYYYYQDCGRKFDLNEREISAPAKTPATGHDFGDEWIPCEGGVHAKFCANCDEFQSAEHTFANGNVQCSVCGGEEELTHVAAKAATCTETGNVEYWYSQITGKKYADAAGNKLLSDVTVAATGHEMSGWQDAANGIGHKQVCMNTGCNHTLTANHDNTNSCFCTECGGFKTGHDMEMKNAVPATCAKEGTQAYFKCSCGKMFDMGYNQIEAPVAIKALNHNYDNAKVQKDAKSGQHYVACADCGKKVYQDHAMQMSDPMKGNYHQYLCSCGELEIETHYDKNGDNKCDVCGHSMGGTQETTPVQQHDNKTVVTGQAGQTQSSNSWWQNWLEALTPGTSGGSTSTEKAPEANTSTGSNAAASGNTASNGNASTGNATTGNTNTGNSTGNGSTVSGGNASGSNTGSTTTAPAAPSVEQTSVIAQFITWFLGLFGF